MRVDYGTMQAGTMQAGTMVMGTMVSGTMVSGTMVGNAAAEGPSQPSFMNYFQPSKPNEIKSQFYKHDKVVQYIWRFFLHRHD
jgi:hypothetical protein